MVTRSLKVPLVISFRFMSSHLLPMLVLPDRRGCPKTASTASDALALISCPLIPQHVVTTFLPHPWKGEGLSLT